MDGMVATPAFGFINQQYILPNKPDATVGTSVSDFFMNGAAPEPECGICQVSYNHEQDFDCSEVGENTVEVTIVNGIGVPYVNKPKVTVIDDKPPNMITKSHTVYLNEFGVLEETDIVSVDDVVAGTWDNCGIGSRSVNPTPVYQCADEGPQSTTLTVVDVNNNINAADVLITVDDSARLGIGNDQELEMPGSPTKSYAVAKMKDDFNFVACKEIGVYMRPDGEPNFSPLTYRTWTGDSTWVIPDYDPDDAESVAFYEALCSGTGVPPIGCKGEVKAEVLCKDRTKGTDKKLLKQTCYRAKLVTA